jgi:DNA-binding response OmpR family regulator
MVDMTRYAKTVLVIEHDLWMRHCLADFLSLFGYNVIEASNGLTGLRLAELHGCDVILLGLALPELSGLDTLSELKRRNGTREIPVILVGGCPELMQDTGLHDASAIIRPPVAGEELVAELGRALTRTVERRHGHAATAVQAQRRRVAAGVH